MKVFCGNCLCWFESAAMTNEDEGECHFWPPGTDRARFSRTKRTDFCFQGIAVDSSDQELLNEQVNPI